MLTDWSWSWLVPLHYCWLPFDQNRLYYLVTVGLATSLELNLLKEMSGRCALALGVWWWWLLLVAVHRISGVPPSHHSPRACAPRPPTATSARQGYYAAFGISHQSRRNHMYRILVLQISPEHAQVIGAYISVMHKLLLWTIKFHSSGFLACTFIRMGEKDYFLSFTLWRFVKRPSYFFPHFWWNIMPLKR